MSIKKELRDYEVYFDFTNESVVIEAQNYSDDLDLETFKKMLKKEIRDFQEIKSFERFDDYVNSLNEISEMVVFFDGWTEKTESDNYKYIDDMETLHRDKNADWLYYNRDNFLYHSTITIKDDFQETEIVYNSDIIEIIQDDFGITDDLESIEKIIETIESNEKTLKINDIDFTLLESGSLSCYGQLEGLEKITCDDDFRELDRGILAVIGGSPYSNDIIVYV
jgi:hypothetical protein